MRACLGVGVGGCGQFWADMGKGGQVWMGKTDWAGMGDMVVGGCGYACMSRGRFWQVWADMGKGRQVWMGQTDWAGMGDMGNW